MPNFFSKFINKEIDDLKSYLLKSSRSKISSSLKDPEEITQQANPLAYKIISKISKDSEVYPKSVFMVGDVYNDEATHFRSGKIEIGRGNNTINSFAFTYAHELGHEKYNKLHGVLTRLAIPVTMPNKVLIGITTALYGFGAIAYPFMGNNKAIELGNEVITNPVVLGVLTTTHILMRAKEHMADLFAHKYTGLNYLEGRNKSIVDKGIIVNMTSAINNAFECLITGYPTNIERQIVVKLFGKVDKDSIEFAEKIAKSKDNLLSEKAISL